jgi:BolA family transcriptional regulator, general stress-responsive regulator
MRMTAMIEERLKSAFAPTALEVIDESHQHHGHAGWREGQTTHVRVRVTSAAFRGDTRVTMHRKINAALSDAFAEGLHALAVEARAEA